MKYKSDYDTKKTIQTYQKKWEKCQKILDARGIPMQTFLNDCLEGFLTGHIQYKNINVQAVLKLHNKDGTPKSELTAEGVRTVLSGEISAPIPFKRKTETRYDDRGNPYVVIIDG
jgi:hypothetical protein